MNLGKIYHFTNGKSWSKLNPGNFPIYGSTGIIGTSDTSLCKGNNTLIARVGMNCGYVQFVDGEYWVTDNTLVATANEDIILPKYGYYLLGTLNLQKYKIGAAQPLLTIGILNSLDVNIHSKDIQRHIVNTISSLLLKSF